MARRAADPAVHVLAYTDDNVHGKHTIKLPDLHPTVPRPELTTTMGSSTLFIDVRIASLFSRKSNILRDR